MPGCGDQPLLRVYAFVYLIATIQIGGTQWGLLVFTVFFLAYIGEKEYDSRRTLRELSQKREDSESLVSVLPLSSKVDQCSICLEESHGLCILPCEHTFHPECLLEWFYTQDERPTSVDNSCPFCRRTVSNESVRSALSPRAAAADPGESPGLVALETPLLSAV